MQSLVDGMDAHPAKYHAQVTPIAWHAIYMRWPMTRNMACGLYNMAYGLYNMSCGHYSWYIAIIAWSTDYIAGPVVSIGWPVVHVV